MIIYPAIDLLNGRCVRLFRGDYNKVTEYSDDPVAVAESIMALGCEWLHVVDLDAARTGVGHNREIIRHCFDHRIEGKPAAAFAIWKP